MNITVELFQKLFPNTKNPESCVSSLNKFLPKHDINTPIRIAAFLAQTGHESQDYTRLSENLNYSATGLVATWPKRFNEALANKYARQPERIANFVYANRMGNGTEASGDGWRYRGRGILQITGKASYKAFGEAVGLSIEQVIPYLETPDGCVESACWFWDTRKLNSVADTGDIRKSTKIINGGNLGLTSRVTRYERYLKTIRET